MVPAPVLTTEDLLADMDRTERQITAATRQAETARIKESEEKKAESKQWTINALSDEIAVIESQRSPLTEAYANLWFNGDRVAGAAMVDARIAAFRTEIEAHEDIVDGNEWLFKPGDTISLARLWPAMKDNPHIARWLSANEVLDQTDFLWRLVVRSEGTNHREYLPPEVAAMKPDITGTGFWVSPDGHLVTNYHVVAGAKSIELRLASRRTVPASLVKGDEKRGLALLKADVQSPEWLPLSADEAGQGVDVFTQGFPNIAEQGLAAKYSDGKISRLSGIGDDENFYQVTAPVQPGNSGGALIHVRDGVPWVVGVVSGNLKGGENVNCAIKSTVLRGFLEEFEQGEKVLAGAKAARPKDSPVEYARKASCLVLVRKR